MLWRRKTVDVLHRAYKHMDRGRMGRARAGFETAAASADDPVMAAEALFQLSGILERQGDIDGAKAVYERVLASGVPGYGPNAGVLLGSMLLRHGDLAGAQRAFELTIEYRNLPLREWPADRSAGIHRDAVNWPFQAAVGLEVVLERRGDVAGAEQARELSWELARMEEPARVELHRAGELEFFEHTSGAVAAYARAYAAKRPPWSVTAALQLGALLRRQGDNKGARDAYAYVIAEGDAAAADLARFHIAEIRALDEDSSS
jgi:predicted negative regulator of RcsB-dependent stress response